MPSYQDEAHNAARARLLSKPLALPADDKPGKSEWILTVMVHELL
jgi:hypothetical protein